MRRGREGHACAMQGTDVFVIGGELGTKNSIEIWNGRNWTYSMGPVGATNLKLISHGRNLYLFGGWISKDGTLRNKIWQINDKNEFYAVGSTAVARSNYALFTVPRGFLTNCQGRTILL